MYMYKLCIRICVCVYIYNICTVYVCDILYMYDLYLYIYIYIYIYIYDVSIRDEPINRFSRLIGSFSIIGNRPIVNVAVWVRLPESVKSQSHLSRCRNSTFDNNN